MAFSEAIYCYKKDSTKIEPSQTRYVRDNQLSRICTMIIFYIALFDVAQATSNSRCHPLDYRSCRYGGECISVSTYPYGVEFEPSEYRCRCNYVDYAAYSNGPEPVCGSDGVTYYNDVHRRLAECAHQRPIEKVCKGICGLPTCKKITNAPPRCPADYENYCFNFGECLMSSTKTAYCKCLPGYAGPRCGIVVPKDIVVLELFTQRYLVQRLMNRR